MAFTNIWDDTFPADTQLANLLGQDLRNFRTDAQERMASISGLDAAKPAFGADTQPVKWNGILFFATDTGKIYQFNNPAWTDVTASFIHPVFRNSTIVQNIGNTTLNTIYTALLPAAIFSTATQIRITIPIISLSIVSGSVNVVLNFGAGPIWTPSFVTSGSHVGINIFGGNYGALAAQTWHIIEFTAATGSLQTSKTLSTVNTGLDVTITLTCQNVGNVNNSTTFDGMMIEVF